jgi:transposase
LLKKQANYTTCRVTWNLLSPFASLGPMFLEKYISGAAFCANPVYKLCYILQTLESACFVKQQYEVMSKKNNQQKQPPLALGIIYPQAAGLDVGSMSMFISYPARDGIQTVKEYNAYTQDLHEMAKDLQQAGITHLAMEATGIYWMPVYEMLEKYGLNVTLVNARHYKNVDAQKTDVRDCQWLQQLHAHGLLRASHIAEEQYRELRIYIHERNVLQNAKADTLNRIQKVLTQMNIKFQHVISDIEGITGMKIIQRIAEGVTDGEALLEGVKTEKLKASKEILLKSLKGIFKVQYQTVLKNHLITHRFYQQQMLAYEHLIEEVLKKILPPDKPAIKKKTVKPRKNQYHFNLKDYLHKIVGVDLTEIDGLDEIAVLTIISVVGLNMNKWPTAQHFASWLNLAARPRKSGGKLLGHQKRFTNNPATQALRLAAQTMWQHKGLLGSLYRRLSHTKGSKKAIKAVARRLAIIFYHMVKKQTNYDPRKVMLDEEKLRRRKIARLQKEAEKLGCKLEIAA